MPDCCPLALHGVVAIRASMLNDDCTYMTGECSSYANTGVIAIEFEEELSEGREVEAKDADGNLCLSTKECDALKRYNVSGSFCSLSAEAAGVLFGSNLLENPDGDVIGFGQPAGKVCHPALNFEIFTRNGSATGKCAPVECSPLFRFMFPCVRLRMTNWRFNEEAFEWSFEGTAEANPRVLDGPYSDLEVSGDLPGENIINGWAIDELPDTLTLDTCCQPVPDDANDETVIEGEGVVVENRAVTGTVRTPVAAG